MVGATGIEPDVEFSRRQRFHLLAADIVDQVRESGTVAQLGKRKDARLLYRGKVL
jgi:hypothetical protein